MFCCFLEGWDEGTSFRWLLFFCWDTYAHFFLEVFGRRQRSDSNSHGYKPAVCPNEMPYADSQARNIEYEEKGGAEEC